MDRDLVRSLAMRDRIRRLFASADTTGPEQPSIEPDRPETPPGAGGPTATNPLPEGVYTQTSSRIVHYVADGHDRPMCGRPIGELWRWSSAWYRVEVADRCKRCDRLVGDRGKEAHGLPTEMDLLVFGIEPPPGMPEVSRAWYRAKFEKSRQRDEEIARRAAAFAAPPGTTFSDPPYVYDKHPARPRVFGESTYDRVINDVYTKTGSGKKWHRVYETHQPGNDPVFSWYGRTLLFPCGNSGGDFERNVKGELYAPPIRTDIPPPGEICRGCAQSDAKYGKGDIPNDSRWDR